MLIQQGSGGVWDAQLPLMPAVSVHGAILKINLTNPGLQGDPTGGHYGQLSKLGMVKGHSDSWQSCSSYDNPCVNVTCSEAIGRN